MKKFMFLILALVVTVGCGAIHAAKIREQTLNDPGLSPEIRTAIVDGKIKRGMTKDQVLAAWGNPCSYCRGTRVSSVGEWWEYNPFGSGRYSYGNGTHLFFGNDGKLQYWSK